jgi:Holliday junction resolvase-like predicted endonuclease
MARAAYCIIHDGKLKEIFFFPEPLDKAGFKQLAEHWETKFGEDVIVRRVKNVELAEVADGLNKLFAPSDDD